MPRCCIVQLPFPSTREPDRNLSDYYLDYDKVFRQLFPEYFIPSGGLWEMPLWVAHLTALMDSAGFESTFQDLSQAPAEVTACVEALMDATVPGELVLASPLAQNFRLTLDIARRLEAAGRRVVLGGNMAPLAPKDAVHLVHRGQLDVGFARRIRVLGGSDGGESEKAARRGLSAERITWTPEYRHLENYGGSVPLIRLNASHGCLYECAFCGDAWSRQLTLVSRDALAAEVDDIARRFPDTRLLYIGDKTFGQSREAVQNLIDVFRDRPGYRFIVQTHVMQVKDWVVDSMRELGVIAVELGFESADSEMMKRLNKLSRGLDHYTEKIHDLKDAGLHIVLNMMGGLDEETEQSHRQTLHWLRDNSDALWLFNLYNFVPYPLIPDFARLRDRIVNWDFADWREDAPVVYRPAHLTPERSWELFQEKIAAAHRIVRASTRALTTAGSETR
ncbi:radical SAM protein [Micromonospora sp. B11E3]|uniref:B12-binding domain-containing radical SAM protein n=1 Tax=Micromonospora sp. B11E3 TaxID=3153562 RepID=UPI00325C6D7C